MPWFPGHPKSTGWNLNSFGLFVIDMAGKQMNLYFLPWWLWSTVPVLPYVTWLKPAVRYLLISLDDCAVHCLPHPWGIPHCMSCASKIWSSASSPPLHIPFGCSSLLCWPVPMAHLGFSSKPTCALMCSSFHCGQLKSCWDSHCHLGSDQVPKVDTSAGTPKQRCWCCLVVSESPSRKKNLVLCLLASCSCRGCLNVSLWTTECIVPWLVCWVAPWGVFPVLTRSPLPLQV